MTVFSNKTAIKSREDSDCYFFPFKIRDLSYFIYNNIYFLTEAILVPIRPPSLWEHKGGEGGGPVPLCIPKSIGGFFWEGGRT